MSRIILKVPESKIVLRQLIRHNAPKYYHQFNKSREFLSIHDTENAEKYTSLGDVEESIISPEDVTPANMKKIRLGIWVQGKFVGGININPSFKYYSDKAAEIGYWVGVGHQKNGYVSRSLDRVIGYCFESLGLEALYAVVKPTNIPSCVLLKSRGFDVEDPDFEGSLLYRLVPTKT